MFDSPVLVLLLAVMIFGLIMWLRRVNGKIKRAYTPIHDYKVVDPQDFPHIDLNFYDIISVNLQLEGLSYLADIEDTTLTSVYPNLRTFFRCLLSEDGMISAAIYIINDINGPANVKKVDLVTEFSDGSFLSSTLGAQGTGMSYPPNVRAQFYGLDTPIEEFIKIHKNRLELLQRENTQAKPIAIKTLEDYIESSKRTDQLMAKYRKELGNKITLKEFFKMTIGSFVFVERK